MLYEHVTSCQEFKEKLWGKEFWIINNDRYCGKLLLINKRSRCSVHFHKIKQETFFVVSGKILLEIINSNERLILSEGMSFTINPYVKHRFTGITHVSEVIEFSSQHFEDDSYRETNSQNVINDSEWEGIKNYIEGNRI